MSWADRIAQLRGEWRWVFVFGEGWRRRIRSLAPLLVLLALVLPLGGCGSLQEQYVAADRLTYEVVFPEWQAYYDADPDMSPAQRERRDRKGTSWLRRIEEGEAPGGEDE